MDTERIITWISQNIIQILIILTVFIQITPIKWNPITSFVTWIGKIITKEIDEKFNKLDLKINNINANVNEVASQVEENEKDRIRWEVLDFANSCHIGKLHTKDEYQHIIALNDKYHKLLAITDDQNGVFDAEYVYIQKLYAERLEKNDFL